MPRESRLWQPCLWRRNFKLNSPHVRTRISAGRTGRLNSNLNRCPLTCKLLPARNAEDSQSDSDIRGRARLTDACPRQDSFRVEARCDRRTRPSESRDAQVLTLDFCVHAIRVCARVRASVLDAIESR